MIYVTSFRQLPNTSWIKALVHIKVHFTHLLVLQAPIPLRFSSSSFSFGSFWNAFVLSCYNLSPISQLSFVYAKGLLSLDPLLKLALIG